MKTTEQKKKSEDTLPLDLNNVSTEQLEKLLTERKAEQMAAEKVKRTTYEKNKETLISELGIHATEVSEMIQVLNKKAFDSLNEFRVKMLEYGDIKGGENNKGNFELKNEKFKILFTSQVKKEFDEKAELAEIKLKSFLNGFVKNRDKKLYTFIMAQMERNSVTKKLDINNINRLYKIENEFEEQDWKDAIRLFKESYNPTGTELYIRFYSKNDNGGWKLINLNFSSI